MNVIKRSRPVVHEIWVSYNVLDKLYDHRLSFVFYSQDRKNDAVNTL